MIALMVASMLPPTGLALPGHAEQLPEGFPVRKGAFALCRAGDLPDPERAWLARFEVLLTNGHEVPSEHVRDALQRSGCRLFRYFWLNGFPEPELSYTLPDGRWRNDLVAQHPEWLLSSGPLPGPPGTPPSWYFDFGQPGLVSFLVRLIGDFRRAKGYAGTFFDYAGVYALPDEVRALWDEKHPGVPYDRAVIGFLKRLREQDPRGLIATNQAHRSAEPLLRWTDHDVIESYGTSYAWGPATRVGDEEVGETFVRPWKGPGGVQQLYGALSGQLRDARPRRAMLSLDYMRPWTVPQGEQLRGEPDVEAVYYSYCAAALFGLSSFCSGWYGLEYRGPLYFADLGRPLGDGPQEVEGIAVREYERGLIALMTDVTPAQATWALRSTRAPALYDLLAGVEVPVDQGRVTVRLEPVRSSVSGAVRPTARVYLKLRARDREATGGP